jgi:nitroimidazol reductase NimA-like FMN-containing flavoprotein (pyridoxamine 5'-phosphate oxidase superfamily)
MAVMDGRTWLEHLPTSACWALLATSPIGRIGVLVDSAPEVYPVNFVVDGESILFRTDVGNKLRGLDKSPSVCFEADGFDVVEATGWSVLVKGRATKLTDSTELRRARELPLRLWPLGQKPHWIRITPSEVTGRRIHQLRDSDRKPSGDSFAGSGR